MAESALFLEVHERLVRADLSPAASRIVAQAFDGVPGSEPASRRAAPTSRARARPVRAYLSRVGVAGFRGVGPPAVLPLHPGPGLTVVVGRNGSGKSSFAEALEVALTGGCRRVTEAASRALGQGWRNLHHAPPFVEVDVQVVGQRPVRVRRTWADAGALTAGTSPEMARLGWEAALEAWRPFLGYDELGRLVSEDPSRAFDALSPVLGLGELAAALARIAEARDAIGGREHEARRLLVALQTELDLSVDPRADDVALRAKVRNPDLEGLAPFARCPARRVIVPFDAPCLHATGAAAERLRGAAARAGVTAGRATARAERALELLERALAWHDPVATETCPVCSGGQLDGAWRERTALAVRDRQAATAEASTAARALSEAIADARALLVPPPPAISDALRDRWTAWTRAPLEPLALAAHLDEATPDLVRRATAAQEEATPPASDVERAWEPARRALALWLDARRPLVRAAQLAADLDAAGAWLASVGETIRAERFAPLRERALSYWSALREGSTVRLALSLEAGGTHRRVGASVAVDGGPSVALAAMSQGELHALALCLFLPRVQQADCPFGFVVLDDPVQSMGPHEVDGLARVLADVARTRQVVVFTHDLRLGESIRRLRIPARVLRVTRGSGSVVHVAEARAPHLAFLEDAEALVHSRDKLGEALARRIVPGLCRAAIEAVVDDAIRARLLGGGVAHAHVEEQIDGLRGLDSRFALAWFGSATDGGAKVKAALRERLGEDGVWVFESLQPAPPGGFGGDVLALLQSTRELITRLR